MKVIIDIPDIIINGVAGLVVMQTCENEDSKAIYTAMEQYQKTEQFELRVGNDRDSKQVQMAVATLVLAQIISDIERN